MSKKILATRFLLSGILALASNISAQPGGPVPYARIANPLPDTMDQLYRDSLNIRFSKVRVNQAGYSAGDRKFFYVVGGTGTSFQVIDDSKAQVATGTLRPTGSSTSGQLSIRASNNAARVANGDTRYTMAGPVYAGAVSEGEIPLAIAPGRYRVVAGADTSAPFVVDDNVYSWVKDALLKFYGANRDGATDSWFHPPAHLKDGPNGDGSLTGSWYDCGDHLKESITMSHSMAMLALYAAAFPERDLDKYGKNHNDTWRTDGVPDILYEAKIGVDFFMKSYDLAQGDPSKMITSIGSFGGDHGWWGQPQFQEGLPHDRGGPVRDVRVEVGANVMGRVAAGLAFFSRQYAPFDKAYADRCLAAAKKMYAYGKVNYVASGSTGAYPSDTKISDDMALAAVALLWASKDTTYKYELIADPSLGTYGNTGHFVAGTFPGGWFADKGQGYLSKGGANTSYANLQMPTYWAFYRLILRDPAIAATYGITTQRLDLIEDVIFGVIDNIGWLGGGSASITLPAANPALFSGGKLTYDPLWKINTMGAEWVYNRYVAGNSSDFFCYYDIAKDLQGVALPHTPATVDWKAEEVRQLLVRQMDYMLGVNPWDISMIYGVGAKNFNHPHHRGANPEGSNLPGAFYRYRPPVGALHGGFPPPANGANGLYTEFWGDYIHSESCIDGSANIMLPVIGLQKDEPIQPLTIQVHIEYVGVNTAIITLRPSRYATTSIRYGISATALTTVKAGDSAGMEQRIVLTGLTPATTYYFQAEATDLKGITGINDNAGRKFIFTTLAQPPGAAQIAQVKVCNVTHNSAEILWYTPNGDYDSKVVFGTARPPTQVKDGDNAGHPVKLHYVTLTGLKERTQYWFYVESNGARDDNQGQFYTFTTRVEHVNFDVRALTYNIDNKPYLGFNIINQDIKSYDSLDVRFYLRATEAEMVDFSVRADIGQAYLSTGFLDPTNAFKTALDALLRGRRPTRMDETYDLATNTYYWYMSMPMGNALMQSGARFRVDVTFVENHPVDGIQDRPCTRLPNSNDWTWAKHSVAQGDPVDFGGIQPGTKDGVDIDYIRTEIDPYFTVYRKGQFVWGYSPSAREQATKVTNYKMDARITSPLNNPPEDHKVIDQSSSTVNVRGTVTISDAGKLTDIWVNGERVADLSQVATFDARANLWNLNIPVRLKQGPNEVDITLFGGADPTCQGCVGCAFANRHFYLEFNKANAYPSTLTLLKPDSTVQPNLATLGQTQFLVKVQDQNGDKSAAADSLQVTVANPNQGDSLSLTLFETGAKTGIFISKTPVAVLDLAPAATGPLQIAMSDGDTVWVVYRDPTDDEDVSRGYLYTPATFPLAVRGWYRDEDGNGAVDKAVVLYSRDLAAAPDSLQLWFPDPAGQNTYRSSAGGFVTAGNRLDITLTPNFANGITGFTGDNANSGRSFLTAAGRTRLSAFTLADSAGPVLNRVELRPAPLSGTGGLAAEDTLVMVFSESIRYSTGFANPFQPMQGGQVRLASGLIISRVLSSQGDRWTFLVAPASTLQLNPGDSLHIAGGISDSVGNSPHTQNRWVVVEGQARAMSVRGWLKDGNGDGTVEKAVILYPAGFTTAPDSLQLWFPDAAAQNTYRFSAGGFLQAANRVEIDLTPPFANGVTGFTGDNANSGRSFVTQDGATRIAAFALIDSAGPVLNRVELRPSILSPTGTLTAEDTLAVTFSETIAYAAGYANPFQPMQNGRVQLPAGLVVSRVLGGQAAQWTFLLAARSTVQLAPGDSLRIAGGIADGVGNAPHAGNRWVVVEGLPRKVASSVTLQWGNTLYHTGAWTTTGPNWAVVRADAAPVPPQPWVLFESTAPFRYEAKIFTHLGGFVTSISGEVGPENFPVPNLPGAAPSGVRLIWNAKSADGAKAGTGAYVWRVEAMPLVAPGGQGGVSQTRRIGLIRDF